MKIRRLASTLALALAALGALGAAPALAAPVFNLDIHHNQTNFPPAPNTKAAQLWFDIDNVGDENTSGPVKLTVHLPTGLTRKEVKTTSVFNGEGSEFGNLTWSCPGLSGTTTFSCTTSGVIPRHTHNRDVVLFVNVSAAAEGDLTATAEVEGGGAAIPALASETVHVSSEPAAFGIVPGSMLTDFFKANGLETERQAGGHPNNLAVGFDFNSVLDTTQTTIEKAIAAGNIRDLTVDLPPGFIGNPTAVGECTQAQFTVAACPASSVVGRFDGDVHHPQATRSYYAISQQVFNMAHPRGAVSDLAFVVQGNPVHVYVSLDPEHNYAIVSKVANVNESLPPFDSKVTIWGTPADSSHDSERCPEFGTVIKTSKECSTDLAKKPFLSMPDQCEAENTFRLHDYDSWQNTGVFGPEIDYTMPGKMTGCEKPRFEPEISLEPTGHQANTPTGLNVSVHVPQNENPNAVATPPIKSTVVTLPEGMTVNPGFADGLEGCSLAQIGMSAQGVPNGEAVDCPDNSRIGEVTLRTPLLPQPIEGSMYLAKQEENPFHSLLAVYLALHDTEERGVLVKVAGKISLNPATGQITTSFEDLPQFPFEDLTLKFRSGERAPLINPPNCGSHEIAATMSSYARPNETLNLSNSYRVAEGPGGGACQDSLSQRPFEPQLQAGTLNPVAGAFSPLSARVFRSDSDQELSTAEGVAPLGLTASLRGVSQCSDAQIAAAAARSNPGQGALEQADPSCPANSQIGTVQTGAGAGPSPIYVPGKIYLAGPYEGAPLSGVAIVPAVAGPVDLGVVVVRAPAYVNPETAQVSLKTDKLPQIVHGVLIRVRDVRIHLDRPNFTLNPTNCSPMAIGATLHSTEGKLKADSERFQVGSCASLGFKPQISLKLRGGTRRGSFPALRAVVRPRPGDANIARAAVTLPHSAFLEQGHFKTICTRVQFAAGAGNGTQCPEGSIYGHAAAYTPLLDSPLEGPVYLRSSNHNLPDLVVALHGPPSLPIDFDLDGRVDSVHGGIRNTFETTPDAPVSEFVLEMQGGRKGLIVNSTNLCQAKHLATAKLIGQNGAPFSSQPVVRATGCGAKRGHKKGKAHARKGAGRR